MENFKENSYKIKRGKENSSVEIRFWDPFIDTVIEKSIVVPNENLEEFIESYKIRGFVEGI